MVILVRYTIISKMGMMKKHLLSFQNERIRIRRNESKEDYKWLEKLERQILLKMADL